VPLGLALVGALALFWREMRRFRNYRSKVPQYHAMNDASGPAQGYQDGRLRGDLNGGYELDSNKQVRSIHEADGHVVQAEAL
jgi:hypothetical protein